MRRTKHALDGKPATVVISLVLPILIIIGWCVGSATGSVNPSIIPTPQKVWEAYTKMLSDGSLGQHILASFSRVLKGFALGAVFGTLLGLLIGLYFRLNQLFATLIGILRPIPKTFQAGERAFKDSVTKYPTKIVASAFSKRQLQRLYEETGITGYVTDLEVLDPNLFPWISPGKAEFVGYQGWKQRLFDAVDVFGRGQVHCGIVGGVEMAQPNGYTDEDEALKQVLTEAEDLGRHGVTPSECVWVTVPKSYFAKQITPSLDYYVRLAKGLSKIRQDNGLNVYIDDYRRCGNHPSHDLARIDKVE